MEDPKNALFEKLVVELVPSILRLNVSVPMTAERLRADLSAVHPNDAQAAKRAFDRFWARMMGAIIDEVTDDVGVSALQARVMDSHITASQPGAQKIQSNAQSSQSNSPSPSTEGGFKFNLNLPGRASGSSSPTVKPTRTAADAAAEQRLRDLESNPLFMSVTSGRGTNKDRLERQIQNRAGRMGSEEANSLRDRFERMHEPEQEYEDPDDDPVFSNMLRKYEDSLLNRS
jgi:hypothetical protein